MAGLMNCGTEKGLLQHKARNEYPCKFCLPFRDTKHKPTPNPPAKCGTTAGRNRHRWHGEPVCDPCREAFNAYRRNMTAKKNPTREPRTAEIKHGTAWGYQQHRQQGVPYCDECREANNTDQRKRYKPSTRVLVQCGTDAGRRKHKRNNQPVCDACQSAPQPERKKRTKK